jgi:signal-transduction protein with cAMP-binding, CBS, and nucleotidyltransferase domain
MAMSTTREMLEVKGDEVWSILASQSVYEAVALMADKEVGALMVVNDQARLMGIISERDYARKVILNNKSSRDTLVADIMTRNVIYVGPSTNADTCMSLMSQKKIRHLPVVEDHIPLGMITVGDLLKFIIQDQELTIEELQSYILGETGGEG